MKFLCAQVCIVFNCLSETANMIMKDVLNSEEMVMAALNKSKQALMAANDARDAGVGVARSILVIIKVNCELIMLTSNANSIFTR